MENKEGDGKRRSPVWQHFRELKNLSKVKCLLCGQELAYNDNTSSMLRHIRAKHENAGASKPLNTDQAGAAGPSFGVDNTLQAVVALVGPCGVSHMEGSTQSRQLQPTHSSGMESRSGKQKSQAWVYFKKVSPNEVQCSLCQLKLAYNDNTSSMWGHLRAKHNISGTSQPCSTDRASGPDSSFVSNLVALYTRAALYCMKAADDLLHDLVNGQSYIDKEALATAVEKLLDTCQPYFDDLESTAQSAMHAHAPPSLEIIKMCEQLWDHSQQLHEKLEELVLTCANYKVLCLSEREPHSVSHFYIGQFCVDGIRVTTFRYCKPTPYLARENTGLYKRIRWNIQRLEDQPQTDRGQGGMSDNNDYYFLCYEDINGHRDFDRDNHGAAEHSGDDKVKLWYIVKWVQVYPAPNDWICGEVPEVPAATYERMSFMGLDEPSCRSATDCLLQRLLSPPTE
ncbi:UPF0575 protein C19orf67 homolog isoform X2 [Sphaeramia orbicularis]|uniref:UPF0575 protein C19orf67 homolog n=1 Tax=Sphaeramia orbicularis TaxID=375764 RepID=A0A673CUN8_9TELE|nr:UPF0575 protein C19orf67 homolog isoform X2 [Sphaeramia orbicularis]